MYFLSKKGKLTSHRVAVRAIFRWRKQIQTLKHRQDPQLVLGQKVEFSMQRLQAGSEVANLPAALGGGVGMGRNLTC